MKWRKVERSDSIAGEMVKAYGDFGIRKMTELASQIYNSGKIPEKMKELELIVNTNKGRNSALQQTHDN